MCEPQRCAAPSTAAASTTSVSVPAGGITLPLPFSSPRPRPTPGDAPAHAARLVARRPPVRLSVLIFILAPVRTDDPCARARTRVRARATRDAEHPVRRGDTAQRRGALPRAGTTRRRRKCLGGAPPRRRRPRCLSGAKVPVLDALRTLFPEWASMGQTGEGPALPRPALPCERVWGVTGEGWGGVGWGGRVPFTARHG